MKNNTKSLGYTNMGVKLVVTSFSASPMESIHRVRLEVTKVEHP